VQDDSEDLGQLQQVAAIIKITSKTVADTLAAQVVTSDAVIATLKANIAITKAVEVLITDAGGAGTGLGPTASLQGNPTTLEDWFNAAIVTETP
ncbi:hypothetical protein LCGC14_2882090, partial [marine sediment metagenome]